MEFQLPVLQDMYETVYGSKGLGYFSLVRCAKFKVSIGLEFLRSLAEGVTQTLAKLQLGFALRGVAVGKPFLAEVIDRGQYFLQF